MLMKLDNLIATFDLKITGVVHVGAHTGEEAFDYHEAGIKRVWWIEGNPDIIETLRQHVEPYQHHVVCALVADVAGDTRTFNVTNYQSLSSSLFPFGTHKKVSPDVYFVEHKELVTSTLDSIVEEHGIWGCNFLNMDLQGAELLALRGAGHLLSSIDYVFTEINVDELYVGCVRLPQLDTFLNTFGFKRVATNMAGSQKPGPGWVGWGDSLYIKNYRNG